EPAVIVRTVGSEVLSLVGICGRIPNPHDNPVRATDGHPIRPRLQRLRRSQGDRGRRGGAVTLGLTFPSHGSGAVPPTSARIAIPQICVGHIDLCTTRILEGMGHTRPIVTWRPNWQPQKGPCTKAGAGLCLECLTSGNPFTAP